jgi:hypothetical protein
MCERETENLWAAGAVRRLRHAHGRGMDDRKVSLPRFKSHNKKEGLKNHECTHNICHRSRHRSGTCGSRLMAALGF